MNPIEDISRISLLIKGIEDHTECLSALRQSEETLSIINSSEEIESFIEIMNNIMLILAKLCFPRKEPIRDALNGVLKSIEVYYSAFSKLDDFEFDIINDSKELLPYVNNAIDIMKTLNKKETIQELLKTNDWLIHTLGDTEELGTLIAAIDNRG